MPLDESLRHIGFRRWYERQLIEGHAWLVTAVLASIMVAIALEAVEVRGSAAGLLTLVLVVLGGGALVVVGIRRFHALLARAEAIAGQAVCDACRSYARFDVLQARDSPSTVSGRSVRVRCRACAHEWQMG